MGKALVIKGVNFSTNKLTTVEFNDIPCTGIAITESSIALTVLGVFTVEYSVTPANTTDDVEWTSSDSNIISVSGSTLTAVGIGTATLTATCGSYSDTVSVTVTASYTTNWRFGGANISSATEASPNGYISASNTTARIYTSGSGPQATQYTVHDRNGEWPAVKIPGNTGRIKVKTTNNTYFNNSGDSVIIWAKDENAGSSLLPTAIKPVSAETAYNIFTETEKIFTVPSTGVDAFVFTTRIHYQAAEGSTANDEASTGQLTIEFLLAETT